MSASLLEILVALSQREVEYVLVGGMAAVLHGAPLTTQDIDVVHERSDENVERLLAFLERVNARYRGQPGGRILSPTADALRGGDHHNLTTDLGFLDLLGELEQGQGYRQLLPHTEVHRSGELAIAVVTLEKLVEIKVEAGRSKDRLILPILMKLLKRQG
ncbi:MAG: hypothetical protein R6V85_16515 [Polyangia bacterium]